MQLVLTRPDTQHQALAARLQPHDCWPLPLMHLQPLEITGADKQAIMDLDLFDLVISSSPMASQCFLQLADQYWPQWPVGQQVVCPGIGSAQAFLDQGFACQWPQQTNAQAMLALPVLAQARRVLWLRGDQSQTDIDQHLRARGLSCHPLTLYQRQLLTPSHQQLARLAQADWLLISSAQALEHLARILKDSRLTCCPLLVSSPRLAKLADQLGFRYHLSPGASDHHFHQTLIDLDRRDA